MRTSKGVLYWFGIFACCFMAYQHIQDNLRPNYSGGDATVVYLLGVAPNFFPAIGIPALFLVILAQFRPSLKWFNERAHLMANLVSLSGLVAWEFIQATSTKLLFDWNDVLWTFIGAFIFQLIWTFTPRSFKTMDKHD